jgi:hypothetical protein
MASTNALIILDRISDRGFAHNRYKKILYDGGFHWMRLISLRSLIILPVFEFFETEFIITDKGVLMIKWTNQEYFNLDDQMYYRFSQSILGAVFNYGTFTLSRGGGGLGSRPTEYVYKKVINARLFMATLNQFNIKYLGRK